MQDIPRSPSNQIPIGLKPYFQEYDVSQLDLASNADLVIQRTLDFGNWEEIRWLFKTYPEKRIRSFVREYGERQLQPVTFHYWLKLLRIRKWKSSPFPTAKGELWGH